MRLQLCRSSIPLHVGDGTGLVVFGLEFGLCYSRLCIEYSENYNINIGQVLVRGPMWDSVNYSFISSR
jgi:hypothetical protein